MRSIIEQTNCLILGKNPVIHVYINYHTSKDIFMDTGIVVHLYSDTSSSLSTNGLC